MSHSAAPLRVPAFSCRRRRWASALAACLAMAGAQADEVVLRNGDLITGQIDRLDGGKLTIRTDYAGRIAIAWKEVATLSTDRPVYVVVDESNRLKVRLRPAAEGSVSLFGGDWLAGESVALARIGAMTNEPIPVVVVTGRVSLNASATSGNTETRQFHFDSEAVARSVKNRFTLGGVVERARDGGVETKRKSRVYLKYDHFAGMRVYGYSNADMERDAYKDLALRTTLGAGAGYQFFESREMNLSAELGLNFVNSDFETAPDESYPATRWALKFDRHLFHSKTQLFYEHEAFFAIGSSKEVFVRATTGLRFPLIERLNATAQYGVEWDKIPAPDRVSTDRSALLTIGYHW
ncbi:MAG: DUF481 domain-containing protein [Betaproteobacteria bacterium]|nr:DUF481 domain-containing protein [Betaproteobacteria bacterium]